MIQYCELKQITIPIPKKIKENNIPLNLPINLIMKPFYRLMIT